MVRLLYVILSVLCGNPNVSLVPTPPQKYLPSGAQRWMLDAGASRATRVNTTSALLAADSLLLASSYH